jgi:hypothetical protein
VNHPLPPVRFDFSRGAFALLAVAAIASVACGPDGSSLTDGDNGPGGGDTTAPQGSGPGGLQCTDAPSGRSYVLFDGAKLEESRLKEATAINRVRTKPYAVMAGEYQRVLGAVPPSLKTAGAVFSDPPQRWAEEPQYSGVSMHAIFEITFEGCRTYTGTAPQYAAAPTAESATAECTVLMQKAWNRSPSPDEIGACRDLAVTKLASETNARQRWAYVCSSVLSSTQFLTY